MPNDNTEDLVYKMFMVTTDRDKANKISTAFDPSRWKNPFRYAKPVRVKGSTEITHWIMVASQNSMGKRMLSQIMRGELPSLLSENGITEEDLHDVPQIFFYSDPVPVAEFVYDYAAFLDTKGLELAK